MSHKPNGKLLTRGQAALAALLILNLCAPAGFGQARPEAGAPRGQAQGQTPARPDTVFGELQQELSKAQAVLIEGQNLVSKSQSDTPAARVKLNEALGMFRALNAKLSDKDVLERVERASGGSRQVRDDFNLVKLYARTGEALSLNAISQSHYNLGEWGPGIEFLKLSVAAYGSILREEAGTSDTPNFKSTILAVRGLEASALGDLGGRVDAYVGDREQSIRYLGEALEKYRALHRDTREDRYRTKEALTLLRIGQVYWRESKDRAKAVEFFNRSLEIYSALPDERRMVAQIHESIANVHVLKFDYPLAVESNLKALRIYRELGNKAGEASVALRLAVLHWVVDDTPKVREYVNQTLAILQSPDIVEEWKRSSYTGPASVYNELYAADVENQRLDMIAFAYQMLGDYARSAEYYQKSLDGARAKNDPNAVRSSLASLGYIYGEMARWGEAAASYKQALEISRSRGVAEEIAYDLQNVGWALLQSKDHAAALAHQNEALVAYKLAGVDENSIFTPTYSALLNDVARAHHALGNRKLAILYGKRGVNAIQGERQRIQNLDPVAQKNFLKKKEAHYRNLANWLIEEGRLLEAEQVLRMLKEEEIVSYLRRDAAEVERLGQRADLTREERDALTRYNEIAGEVAAAGVEFGQLQELQKKQALTEEQQKRYEELSRRTRDANRVFGAFLRQLAEEFAGRANVKADLQENLALKSDLKEWGEGVVFLYTLVGEDRYRVILTTARAQADGRTEIKAAELNEKIVRFRQAVQNPAVDPRPLGKELYDILIKPVERQLDGAKAKTLLWSLDGNLRLLPLAALWDGRQYFGQKYQNVIITLASRARIGRPAVTNWSVLGVGVTQQKTVREPSGTRDVSFSALPAVRDELASIVKSDKSPGGVMPGSLLIDADFNTPQLKRELLKGYKVVHIASHFSLNPGDATSSFLLMGDGTPLTVNEIKNDDEYTFDEVELLTLSACQTAVVEKDGTGKEIEGLGYVAQVKGAKAILATLWNVADESTQLLMSEFYRLRNEDPRLTKADALQLAQRSLIEGKLTPSAGAKQGERGALPAQPGAQKKSYAHPYYWSPFVLIGNWR